MTQPQGQSWCLQLLQHSYHKSKSRKNRNTRKCRLLLPLLPSLAQLILGWVKRKNCLWFRAKLAHPKGSSLAGSAGGPAEFQTVEIRPAPSWANSVSVSPPEKFWSYNETTKTCAIEGFCKFKSKTVTSAEIILLGISAKRLHKERQTEREREREGSML